MRKHEGIRSIRHTLLGYIRKVSPRMSRVNAVLFVISIVFAFGVVFVSRNLVNSYALVYQSNEMYQDCQDALDDFQDCSDTLTTYARDYVTTGNPSCLDNYVSEATDGNRRENALDTLRQSATEQDAMNAVEKARDLSYTLQERELYAMRLASPSTNRLPSQIAEVQISAEDSARTIEEKKQVAREMLFGQEYIDTKQQIREQIQTCSTKLISALQTDLEEKNSNLQSLLGAVDAGVVLILLLGLSGIIATKLLLLWPMSLHATSIRNNEPLIHSGAQELRYVTEAYNEMFLENQARTESLDYVAHVDALTGVYNRGAYDDLIFKHRHDCTLILIDIDNFKQFNDEYGHEMGDAILVEVSATLFASFRSTDHVCRIGGDEFAVIMTDTASDKREVIERKIEKITIFLRDTSNGLPAVTLSIGVAFANSQSTVDGLFQQADAALYEAKDRGRDCSVFEEDLKS